VTRKSPSQEELPPVAQRVEPRVRAAWRAWLSSLATDAEAAMAAAHLYAELPDDARDILSGLGSFAITIPARPDEIEFHAVLTVD